MTLAAKPPSGKKCFVYCGDDKCDCDANPKFHFPTKEDYSNLRLSLMQRFKKTLDYLARRD